MILLQAITYMGRTVAAATAGRFFLNDELDRMPFDEPERRFVTFMCDYAGLILRGDFPGPYTDVNARRYARHLLIPGELAERHDLDVDRTAWALRVPSVELRAAQHDRLATEPAQAQLPDSGTSPLTTSPDEPSTDQ